MCNDERLFATIKNDEKLRVYTAADHFVESGGRGDIKLDAKSYRQITNSVKLKKCVIHPRVAE